ncbi:hypothetical protein CRX72_22570 [Pantoea sp. BRM17]|nr:hypothetical protein CRX72_22570 [Pantoea sp. BRM17]
MLGVAMFIGCVSIVSSNAMAIVLDEFPHMAGTASSLAGTLRFGVGGLVGALLSAFLNAGPFVYIEVNHVSPQDFGYYFGLNIIFLFVMTLINSRAVRRFGPLKMFRLGLTIQFAMGIWLAIFWALAIAALITTVLVVTQVRETLKPEQRQRFHLRTMLGNFVALVRHKRVFGYMLASGFSFAGLLDQLILMRFLHGLSAAAASVVINALMRDSYSKEDFSRMMSFVLLITTIAPLVAPVLGGWLLLIWSWQMPQIAREFAVSAGSVQMTLNLYILGFAIGQLVYGPLADSYGRKPVIVLGTLIFACAAAACALSGSM